MIKPRNYAFILIFFVIFGLHVSTTSARHQTTNRRSSADFTPLAASGWTVPLQGRETCTNTNHCSDTLSSPPAGSTLQYLAIGRGTITYSCAGRKAVQAPVYTSQSTFLYDAAPLISKFASEDQFHSYIPRFLDFDYTSLDNSTLACIGDLQRINGLTVFNIYKVTAFTVRVKEIVQSPSDPQFDVPWAHSQDDSEVWNVYRVETAGGGAPYDCGDQLISDEIPVEYAAEYWFYRRNPM